MFIFCLYGALSDSYIGYFPLELNRSARKGRDGFDIDINTETEWSVSTK